MGKVDINSILGATGGVTGIVKTAMDAALIKDTSSEEGVILDLKTTNYDLGDYTSLESLWGATDLAKTSYTMKDVRGLTGWQLAGKVLSAAGQGAMTGLQVGGPWGALIGAVVGTGAGTAGALSGNAKATRKANELNYEGKLANTTFMNNINNNARNIATNNYNNALLNIAALGGPLNANPFSNGVRFIEEGGSHEENPLGGVPQGIAPDGKPNLVEEGEVIFDDYVYSRRLKVPKKDYEMLGLKGKKEYTFADAAEAIQKESEERPNDPLSKNNLQAMFARLQTSQDETKQKRDAAKAKREFNKLSPEELAYMLQAMQQGEALQSQLLSPQEQMMLEQMSQQAQFAKEGGLLGHRFDFWSDLNWDSDKTALGDLTDGSYYVQRYTPAGALEYAVATGDPAKATGIYNAGTEEAPLWQIGVKPQEPPVPTYWNNTKAEDWSSTLPTAAKGQYIVLRNTDSGEPLYYLATGDPNLATGIYKGKKGIYHVGTKPESAYALYARLAPIAGNLAGAISSIFDKPNYSNIERAENMVRRVPNVGFKPIGEMMSYNPMDINYVSTLLGNLGNRVNRIIMENSGGNSAAAMQTLLGSNYKNLIALSDALRSGTDLNDNKYKTVLEFNKGTNTYNSEKGLAADIQNQALALNKALTFLLTAELRDKELAALLASRNANFSNLSTSLGNLGKDKLFRDLVSAMINSGVYETLSPEMQRLFAANYAFGGRLSHKKSGKEPGESQSLDDDDDNDASLNGLIEDPIMALREQEAKTRLENTKGLKRAGRSFVKTKESKRGVNAYDELQNFIKYTTNKPYYVEKDGDETYIYYDGNKYKQKVIWAGWPDFEHKHEDGTIEVVKGNGQFIGGIDLGETALKGIKMISGGLSGTNHYETRRTRGKLPKLLVFEGKPVGSWEEYIDLLPKKQEKTKKVKEPKEPREPREFKDFSTDVLRAAPIIGGLAGAIDAYTTNPNYSNIITAENTLKGVPLVNPRYVGNRMDYNPVDINYNMINAINLNNANLRAAVELSGQISTGNNSNITELFNKAITDNLNNYIKAKTFNRDIESFNSQQLASTQASNQDVLGSVALGHLQSGLLRDAQLALLQLMRNEYLSNVFNNILNFGKDRLSKDLVDALVKSGVYGSMNKEMTSI